MARLRVESGLRQHRQGTGHGHGEAGGAEQRLGCADGGCLAMGCRETALCVL